MISIEQLEKTAGLIKRMNKIKKNEVFRPGNRSQAQSQMEGISFENLQKLNKDIISSKKKLSQLDPASSDYGVEKFFLNKDIEARGRIANKLLK